MPSLPNVRPRSLRPLLDWPLGGPSIACNYFGGPLWAGSRPMRLRNRSMGLPVTGRSPAAPIRLPLTTQGALSCSSGRVRCSKLFAPAAWRERPDPVVQPSSMLRGPHHPSGQYTMVEHLGIYDKEQNGFFDPLNFAAYEPALTPEAQARFAQWRATYDDMAHHCRQVGHWPWAGQLVLKVNSVKGMCRNMPVTVSLQHMETIIELVNDQQCLPVQLEPTCTHS